MAGKYVDIKTKIVEFGYPKFRRPDKKYNDYRVQAIMSPEDAKALRAEFRKAAKDFYGDEKGKKAATPKFHEDEDTGNFSVTFSSKNPPGVFDTKGRVISDKIVIGGGSKGILALALTPYGAKAERDGVKAYLNAVMVTTLVEYKPDSDTPGGAGAFKDMFGKVEGFDASELGDLEDIEDAPKASRKAAKGVDFERLLEDEDELEELSGDEEDDLASL